MNEAGRFLAAWAGVGFVAIVLVRLLYEGWAPHLLDRDPRARPVSSAMCLVLATLVLLGAALASY